MNEESTDNGLDSALDLASEDIGSDGLSAAASPPNEEDAGDGPHELDMRIEPKSLMV